MASIGKPLNVKTILIKEREEVRNGTIRYEPEGVQRTPVGTVATDRMLSGPLIGAVTAGAVAGVVLLLVIVLLSYYCYTKKSAKKKFKFHAFNESARFTRVPRHGYSPSIPTVSMRLPNDPRYIDDRQQHTGTGHMIFRPMPYDMLTLQPLAVSAMTYPRVKTKKHKQKKTNVPNGDIPGPGVYITDGEMNEFLRPERSQHRNPYYSDSVDGEDGESTKQKSRSRHDRLQESLRRSKSADSPFSGGELRPYFTDELHAPSIEKLRENGDFSTLILPKTQDINSNDLSTHVNSPQPNGHAFQEHVIKVTSMDFEDHVARVIRPPTPPNNLQNYQRSPTLSNRDKADPRPPTPPKPPRASVKSPTPPKLEQPNNKPPTPPKPARAPKRPPTPPFDATSIDSQSVQATQAQSNMFRFNRPGVNKPMRPPSPPLDFSIDSESRLGGEDNSARLPPLINDPEYATVIHSTNTSHTTIKTSTKDPPPLPPKNKRSFREWMSVEPEEDDTPVTIIDAPQMSPISRHVLKPRPPTPPPIKKKSNIPSSPKVSALENLMESSGTEDVQKREALKVMQSVHMEIEKVFRRRSHSNPNLSDSMDADQLSRLKHSRQRNPSQDDPPVFPPPDYDDSDLNDGLTRGSGLFKSSSSKSLPLAGDPLSIPTTRINGGPGKSVKFAETAPVIISETRSSSKKGPPVFIPPPPPPPETHSSENPNVPPAPPIPPPPPPLPL